MKKMLQFVKTHLISLLSGLVAIAAVVFCVMGMTADTVTAEMKKKISATGASSIQGLKSAPQNEATIAAEKERGQKFAEEYAATVAVAKDINSRELIMEDAFPEPKKAATPFEFKQEYANKIKVLFMDMNGGMLPTQAEIQEEAQNVEDLMLLEAEQKSEEESDETGRAPQVATGRRSAALGGRRSTGRGGMMPPGAGRMAGGGRTAPGGMVPGGGRMAGGGGRMAGGMAPGGRAPGMAPSINIRSGGEPKYDPVYRARVSKAKSIWCYYDETTFHVSPLVLQDTAPLPEDMWFAQVSHWIQQDVVKAVAALNKEVADSITEGEPSVGEVPVKRLDYIRVLGYEIEPTEELRQGRIAFPWSSNSTMPNNVGVGSLTGRKCNEQFDVVRFVISVVIDQRDIPQLIDQLSRVNFYQCLNASYTVVDHEQEMALGYFYGTDPVVRATFEFEGYLAREVFEQYMPVAVKKLLGIAVEED